MSGSTSNTAKGSHTSGSTSLIFVLGALTAFGPLSIDMYLPSLPVIGKSLGSSAAQVQLTLATFMSGMGIGQLFYGPVSDRLGRRTPLLWGIALYTLASLGCALAPHIQWLIALRFLQALGGAAGPVIARAVVRDLFSGTDIARVLSIMTLVMGAAPILAPVLGGAVLSLGGWRAIFVVLTGMGAVAGALAYWQVPPHARHPPRSALLQSVALLLRDRRFMTSAMAGACAQVTLFAYISCAPFVFMNSRGLHAQQFALIFGTNAAGFIAATQFNRLLLRRASIAAIALGAAVWLCVTHAALLTVTYAGVGTLAFAATLFACVIGLGLLFPNVTALALQGHASIAGLASSLLGAIQFGAGALAAAAIADGHAASPMVIAMAAGSVGALAMTWLLARMPPSLD